MPDKPLVDQLTTIDKAIVGNQENNFFTAVQKTDETYRSLRSGRAPSAAPVNYSFFDPRRSAELDLYTSARRKFAETFNVLSLNLQNEIKYQAYLALSFYAQICEKNNNKAPHQGGVDFMKKLAVIIEHTSRDNFDSSNVAFRGALGGVNSFNQTMGGGNNSNVQSIKNAVTTMNAATFTLAVTTFALALALGGWIPLALFAISTAVMFIAEEVGGNKLKETTDKARENKLTEGTEKPLATSHEMREMFNQLDKLTHSTELLDKQQKQAAVKNQNEGEGTEPKLLRK